ncbi:MAG: hypothetical protein E7Z94_07000 [Actinomyces ruminicola]|nr:hypothetical protein [Actinomyces ruminicola]
MTTNSHRLSRRQVRRSLQRRRAVTLHNNDYSLRQSLIRRAGVGAVVIMTALALWWNYLIPPTAGAPEFSQGNSGDPDIMLIVSDANALDYVSIGMEVSDASFFDSGNTQLHSRLTIVGGMYSNTEDFSTEVPKMYAIVRGKGAVEFLRSSCSNLNDVSESTTPRMLVDKLERLRRAHPQTEYTVYEVSTFYSSRGYGTAYGEECSQSVRNSYAYQTGSDLEISFPTVTLEAFNDFDREARARYVEAEALLGCKHLEDLHERGLCIQVNTSNRAVSLDARYDTVLSPRYRFESSNKGATIGGLTVGHEMKDVAGDDRLLESGGKVSLHIPSLSERYTDRSYGPKRDLALFVASLSIGVGLEMIASSLVALPNGSIIRLLARLWQSQLMQKMRKTIRRTN